LTASDNAAAFFPRCSTSYCPTARSPPRKTPVAASPTGSTCSTTGPPATAPAACSRRSSRNCSSNSNDSANPRPRKRTLHAQGKSPGEHQLRPGPARPCHRESPFVDGRAFARSETYSCRTQDLGHEWSRPSEGSPARTRTPTSARKSAISLSSFSRRARNRTASRSTALATSRDA
jgi:hypothetical protein